MDNGFTILCWFLPHNNMNQPEVYIRLGFPGGSDGEESACDAEDPGLIPGCGRSPGEGKGYPLHYSFLEKSMDRGVHGLQWVGHEWATNSIQMSSPSWAFLPLPTPSHPSRLSQSTRIELPESYGKCPLLSILHTVANKFQRYSLNSSLLLFCPLCPQICFLCLVSIAALQIRSSVPSF